MFVASQTLVVYAPSAQRLNRGCSSSPCSQMQSGWVFSMDGCRTVVFRRYVTSRVCRFLYPLHWFKLVNHLSSVSPTVSMTVLVVLSMLSLPCGVDDRWSCRRRLGRLELCETSKLSSTDVRTSFLKECSLDVFVRSAVRRDLTHNLPD